MSIIDQYEIVVRSGQGDYGVARAAMQMDVAELIIAAEDPFIVIDMRVSELYPEILCNANAKRVFKIRATEEEKTLAGVERVCRFLQEEDASKRSSLVIIGGGIIQDIGMFTAHVYYRGIPAQYVPTTLLSMADSCIGAKCGLNLGEFKNQIGFFQAPRSVTIWPGFLATLDRDDVRSGFGEIVKLAIIGGPQHFDAVSERLDQRGFDLNSIDELIFASLEIKRTIIEVDEYEKDLRKTLNYGHSFGHALEGVTHHEVPHGLAVSWGIDVANYVAFRKGLLEERDFKRVHDLLGKHFSLRVRQPYSAEALLQLMGRDKKAAAGKVTLVLPKAIGDLQLLSTALDPALGRLISDYLDEFDIFTQ